MANSVFFLPYCLVAVFLAHTSHSFLLKDSVCYPHLGCFSRLGAFSSSQRPISVVPSSPDNIRTKFKLYTRSEMKQTHTLDARDVTNTKFHWKQYFKNRPTQFIIHGFIDDMALAPWLEKMKDELLKHGDHNTIIVDWHHGNLPPYTQATANTRVVGAQIAWLIKQLQTDFNVSASQFHIIGHSLGSHIAGYAGERTPGLGRITGLDPAGPYFEGTDKVVRLDPTDADFVDSIHSDGNDILVLGMGTLEPYGHMDFYPNLGHDQPGCKPALFTKLWKLGVVVGTEETVACNHLRSIKFFTESINSKCPFWSFPCGSAEDFKANKCHSCKPGGCASMGFHADKYIPPNHARVKYYTTTANSAPYCQFHIDIKLKMSRTSSATEERGRVKVRLHGNKGTSGWIHLNKDAKTYVPGSTYESEVGVPADFGQLIAVDFKWHHMAPITNPLKWNLFGWRHPKLYVHEIDVTREEQGKEVHFCAGDHSVETDTYFRVSRIKHRC